MDLKNGERINNQRVTQAFQTETDLIATACPFCMQMLEDGVKSFGREEEVKVQDIAELVAGQLVGGR
jgi:Fe-S oxidoreductase